jgi:hypothetical protein
MPRIVLVLLIVGATLMVGACASGGSKRTAPTPTTGATSTSAPTCPSTTTLSGSNAGPETNAAGDIPDQQPFKVYSPPENSYRVKVPEGWALSEAPGKATLTDKLNSIDIRVVAALGEPTIESAKSAEVSELAAMVPCFQLVDVVAILIMYRADAAPDPVTGKTVRDDVERYEFFKNGKEVILTLSAPAGSDNVDPWRVVTDSFTWT